MTFEQLMSRAREGRIGAYDTDKVILYALGVGFGLDPLDENQLDYVCEDRLKVLPAFATVAAWDIDFTLELGVAWSKVIHAAQSMTLFRPLPPSGEVRCDTRTKAAYAKRNGTLLVNQTTVSDGNTGESIAELEATVLVRDLTIDGAPQDPRPKGQTPHGTIPELTADSRPDLEVDIPTSPQVALIYRLLGGRSAIHCDPAAAREQGFDRPIMHGLSTWGHACHAIVKSVCGYQPERLQSFSARFSAPVFPGETLRTRIWRRDKRALFETLALERNKVVLSEGLATVV